MKRKLVFQCKFVVVFAFVAFVFNACKKDDPNSTGLNILPGSDLSQVGQVVEKDVITANTENDVLIRTDRVNYHNFGTFNDPVFGKTTGNMAFQFRLPYYPDYSTAVQADSLVLHLVYKAFYGDTITPQTLKVYELSSDLYTDSTGTSNATEFAYYQDVDLKSLAFAYPIGELEFTPKFEMDTTETDTLVQDLAIKLDDILLQKLYHADTLDMVNNDAFLQFFKGLYIESQDLSEGGGLVAISSLAFGSNLTLHYLAPNEENPEKIDTVQYVYRINSNSARVSSYTHDYSLTDFYANLNSAEGEDSLIYLQTLGGLRNKISIPNLDTWKDSAEYIINKAALVFHVDTIASDYHNYEVPQRLILSVLDEDGVEHLPADFSVSPSLYNGFFDATNATYTFIITHHLQQIIEGTNSNYGFYLSDYTKNDLPRRVVLKGSTSKTGIRLEVTYTKLN